MSPMAQIEAELGVQSTYCVLLGSPWYRIDDPANHAIIESAIEQGHWLGLHFDASAIPSDGDVPECVIAEARRLGEQFGVHVRVVSVSQPRPAADRSSRASTRLDPHLCAEVLSRDRLRV